MITIIGTTGMDRGLFCLLVIFACICREIGMIATVLKWIMFLLLGLSAFLIGCRILILTGRLMNIPNSNTAVIILYNRVDKCGSTLMAKVVKVLSNSTGTFKFVSLPHFDHIRLSSKDQMELPGQLANLAHSAGFRSLFYSWHFHFFKMPFKRNTIFWYINQIRDPLARTLSSFDYMRWRCMASNMSCMVADSVVNLTMEECVWSRNPTVCLTKSYGVNSMIAYFCGQSSICNDQNIRTTSRAALSLAKSNIERFYIYIGLLEYMKNSLELLEHIQPGIFIGITTLYMTKFNGTRVYATQPKYNRKISNSTAAVLRRLLKPEYELYEFVRKRFMYQYMRAFHRPPRRYLNDKRRTSY